MTSRRRLIACVAVLLLAGCAKPGGRVFRYAEAAQIPAPLAEREQLAALLASYAQRKGMYFHDTSPRAQRTSNGRQTLALALDRVLTTGRPWSEIAVSAVGNGPALITFIDPPLSTGAGEARVERTALLAEIRRKWPGTEPVPLLPSGAIPRQEDLRTTPGGLRIDPARAADYGLASDSPLLAR